MQIHESCHQNVAACSSNSGKKSCHQNVINILEGGPAALSTPSFPFYLGRSLNGVMINDILSNKCIFPSTLSADCYKFFE